MKKKIFALLTFGAIVMSAFGAAPAQDAKNAKKTNQLATLLPPSEAVVTIDAKRLFGEALPQILSANQPLLTDILKHFDELKARTGIDYKQFQQVAVGASSIKGSELGVDYEPLVLARGQFNAGALITSAKTAAAGKYREEKIGDRTVYVFSPQSALEKNNDKIAASKAGGFFSKFLVGLNKEMAVTTYDNNTLIVGSLVRVREMLETRTRLGGEVLALVSRKPNAIVSFGAQVPNGLSQFVDLDLDELGANLNGIRQLSGALDLVAGSTVVSIVAKTAEPAQAKNLSDTFEAIRGIAVGSLKGSKGEDKKVYGRMLENAKLVQNANELTLDLQVPQADLNVIVGAKK